MGEREGLDVEGAHLHPGTGLDGLEVVVVIAGLDSFAGGLGEIDGLFEALGDDWQAGDVVRVFVSHKYGINGMRIDANGLQLGKSGFARQTAVNQDMSEAIAEIGGIPGAGTGEDVEAEGE